VLDRIMNHEMYIEEVNHAKNLSMVKLLLLPIILSQKFYLLIIWTTICCLCHNFVRCDIIVCLVIKV
jgi:hypothetical protein